MRPVIFMFLSFIFCVLLATAVQAKDKSQARRKEAQTVEWFLRQENAAALDATLKECNNNPGELEDAPNCINAATALNRKWADEPAIKIW